MNNHVIIIGPAYPLRGGLASFDQRLCQEFSRSGFDCAVYSFSLQYPSILFPGKTQYSTEPPPTGLQIFSAINSINPLNWFRVGWVLRKKAPDIIVVRYWLPFMAPALGTILRMVRRNRHTRIISIADNVLPHEKGWGDKKLTGYFLGACDAFITMSEKVMFDLRRFERDKPAKQVLHPLYDNFGPPVTKKHARDHLHLPPGEKIILFFGFIRKYKGLDILLQAMADPRIRKAGIRLMIAGEFYEDPKKYHDMIRELGIEGQLILKTNFIGDSEVKYYLCSADLVVQPYRQATQSGVTPLAYHFEKPMVVTNVGGLPLMVPDRKVGLIAAPNAASIATAIIEFYELGEDYFIPHLRTEKQKYSWAKLVKTITDLANDISK